MMDKRSSATIEGATYARAGVDITAGDEAVERIKKLAQSTYRPGVLSGVGGFASLFSLGMDSYRHPVLVSSTDGVGTKLLVARAIDRYETIGIDLVAMCVDDLVCVGAEPLFLLDYVAVGKLDAKRLADVVSGVAEGCRSAGCALLGGETAEHPDAMGEGDLDIAGFAVGVVEHGEELSCDRVREGDVLLGLESPGIRSNGYSLARHVLLDRANLSLSAPAWQGAEHSLGDELLVPSKIYAPAVLKVLSALNSAVHACAHITGGGIPGNLSRVIGSSYDARVDRSSWEVPRIFAEIERLGSVASEEMFRVFNMGLGMIMVVDSCAVDQSISLLQDSDHNVQVVGEIVQGQGKVHLI